MKHQHVDTPSRDPHIENMELVQMHIGAEQPFWDLPYKEAGFLAPSGWIQHTWQAIDPYPLRLHGPLATMTKKRTHDGFIMDIFRTQLVLSNKELACLNNCRLHLGVTRLSDITNADGTSPQDETWTRQV